MKIWVVNVNDKKIEKERIAHLKYKIVGDKNKRKILNKNRNILTKSRKLYKNGRHYTRKNLRTQ